MAAEDSGIGLGCCCKEEDSSINRIEAKADYSITTGIGLCIDSVNGWMFEECFVSERLR
jgi:hypothetical protein